MPDASGVPQSDEVALLRERLTGKVQLGVGAESIQERRGSRATRSRLVCPGRRFPASEVGARRRRGVGGCHRSVWRRHGAAGGPPARTRVRAAARGHGGDHAQRAGALARPSRRSSAVTPAVRFFTPRRELENVLRVPQLAVALPSEDWPRARFLAFCAIGNSAAFFDDLRSMGIPGGWAARFRRSSRLHGRRSRCNSSRPQPPAAPTRCCARKKMCGTSAMCNSRSLPVYCCRISIDLPERFLERAGGAAHRANEWGRRDEDSGARAELGGRRGDGHSGVRGDPARACRRTRFVFWRDRLSLTCFQASRSRTEFLEYDYRGRHSGWLGREKLASELRKEKFDVRRVVAERF